MNNKSKMPEINELNFIFRFIDFLLSPFMFVLGGFKFPLQESHPWHMVQADGNIVNDKNSVMVDKYDSEAKFAHESPVGLYHMPIFGGLRKYIVLEVKNFEDHWHVGWKDRPCQVNRLKIYDNRLKLLYGRKKYNAFAINDKGNFLPVEIIGEGEIGDGKFEGVRLF